MKRSMLLGLLAALSATANELDERFDSDVLIIAAQRACHRFDVYLAVTRTQQTRGLMHVRELADDAGMLFLYTDSDYVSMWMKNTYIPLDIAFARNDGTIVNVARHTEPLSLESIASAEPVNYVLELNAGTTERLGIDAGSRLLVWASEADHP